MVTEKPNEIDVWRGGVELVQIGDSNSAQV